MKHIPSIFASLTVGALIMGCQMKAQENYTITFPVGADADNTMAYLVDWDTTEPVDSVIITGGQAVFKGSAENPFIGRINYNGRRGPFLFVENGDITLTAQGEASGTPLNDKFRESAAKFEALEKEYSTLNLQDSTQRARAEAIVAEHNALPEKLYNENSNNLVGLFWFLQGAYEMTPDQLRAAVDANPSLAASKRVKSVIDAVTLRANTSVGKHYADFTVTYDGKEQKLSDYVKPGRYTIVDFWASWCGPCMRQAKVLKELYAKYKDKGLDIVGVAVWDEPENTLAAIKSHGLEWPNIINAQTVPTDLYGINAIPCILLINPEGVIVSRDKQGEELIQDVDKAMEGYVLPASDRSDVAPAAPAAAADTAAIF